LSELRRRLAGPTEFARVHRGGTPSLGDDIESALAQISCVPLRTPRRSLRRSGAYQEAWLLNEMLESLSCQPRRRLERASADRDAESGSHRLAALVTGGASRRSRSCAG